MTSKIGFNHIKLIIPHHFYRQQLYLGWRIHKSWENLQVFFWEIKTGMKQIKDIVTYHTILIAIIIIILFYNFLKDI